jgi:peptidyl-prolyl cis-trans isomerase C
MSKWVAGVFCGLCLMCMGPPRGLAHHTPPRAAATTDPAEIARRSEPVASFQGGVVTIGELEDMILEQNPLMQERYQTMDAVHVLLDRSVRFELLAAEAKRRGYEKAAPVVLATNQSAVQALIQRDFDNAISTDTIPAADVEKYYSDHIEEFVRGEGRRVSMLVLADEAAAKALLPQAQAADLRGFRELARTHSVDETSKQRGGDLPFFDASGRGFDATDSGVEPAVAKAAFALKEVGDTSRPVQVGQRFAIIRLSGIRAATDDSARQAGDRIRERLWRDRRQGAIDAHIEELKKEHHVTVRWELVDAVKLDSGPPLPPSDGLPGGFPHTPERSPQKNSREGAAAR